MKPELQPPPARKRRSDGQPPSEGNAPLPPWGDGVRCLSPSTVGSKAILLCFWQWITTSISGIPRWNSRCTEKAVVGIFSRKQNLEAEKKEGSIEYKLRYCKMNQYRIWKSWQFRCFLSSASCEKLLEWRYNYCQIWQRIFGQMFSNSNNMNPPDSGTLQLVQFYIIYTIILKSQKIYYTTDNLFYSNFLDQKIAQQI